MFRFAPERKLIGRFVMRRALIVSVMGRDSHISRWPALRASHQMPDFKWANRDSRFAGLERCATFRPLLSYGRFPRTKFYGTISRIGFHEEDVKEP
jgi:hypothetical protein